MDILDAAKNINKTHEDDILARLYTPWGESLDPAHVLTEYPRPLMKRDSYTILNGYWSYAFTTSPLLPESYDGRILVPFSPESLLSGVERQLMPEEYLWYARTITIHKEELCPGYGRLLLHFGAVDQEAFVYLNGKEVCSHMGGYLPFEADITSFLHEGDNTIVVRVRDKSDTSYHSRGKQTLKRGGMFYTAQSGIWQTVWMEWVPDHYIKGIKITPDYDLGKINCSLTVSGPEALAVSIYADNRCIYDTSFDTSFKTAVKGSGMEVNFSATLSELHPWTPDFPFLYTLRVTYGKDCIESYFAMRSFTIEPDKKGLMRFCLNHKPLFLHGVLDQGYWPDGLYTAPSDEAFIYDIRTMKKLGFNMMRKHIKLEAPRWYYHCDRLGMIVWQDMVSGGSQYSMPMVCYLPTLFPGISGRLRDDNYKLFSRESEEGRREWIKECEETIDYLYNVVSLAVWVPFNEGWGQFDANLITRLIKEKDPTRPVDQTSGWFDQGGGDFKSIHNYFRRLKVIKDCRAFVLSEYGGYACHIDGHSSVERIYGYKKYKNTKELTKAWHKLIDEELKPLIPQGLCGAVYTQVSDVEEEVNGLLTYDRKVLKLLPSLD